MLMNVWVCIFFGIVSIFFFKQKTAYEMRISDWSSACALPISFRTCIERLLKSRYLTFDAPDARQGLLLFFRAVWHRTPLYLGTPPHYTILHHSICGRTSPQILCSSSTITG